MSQQRTLKGNWFEERIAGENADRPQSLIGADCADNEYKTTTNSHFEGRASKQTLGGPRSRLTKERILREALEQEEEEAKRGNILTKNDTNEQLKSTSKADYFDTGFEPSEPTVSGNAPDQPISIYTEMMSSGKSSLHMTQNSGGVSVFTRNAMFSKPAALADGQVASGF
eukprot:TRINITY_DN2970_c0_g1_i1.p1 TRINITY_DN2970_c0_g1~~TRINITY_DN2970_c0_g1_i1.p1  ORF type:complete len:170 (+),score=28.85 TRINITY_DN2970_c0_g1_i1:86-595(+)